MRSDLRQHSALHFGPTFILIGLWLLGAFLCFAFDRTSHVSTTLLCFPIILNFPNWILVEPDSIAIWNKNKIVMALTISVWATHFACIIQGKYPPHTPLQMNESAESSQL
jgi:hypothetical protein